MSGRTRTAFVAVLAIAVMPADALAGNGSKPKLEAKEKSQKAILDAGAIAVSAKNLDKKITVVAESKTFDSQGFEKISKSLVLKPDDKSGKLPLKKSGKRAIASCQPRKIKLTAKGAKEDAFELKRNSRACEVPELDFSRADECNTITLEEEDDARRARLHAALPRRLPHDRGLLERDRKARCLHRRRDAQERGRHADRSRALRLQRRLQPRSDHCRSRARSRHT